MKNFFSRVIFVILVILNGKIYAKGAVMDYNLLYSSNLQYHDNKRKEKVVHDIQAMLIERIFTSQMMNNESSFVIQSEDEEGFLENKQQRSMINDILSRELASKLADDDLLGIKKQLLKDM